MLTKLTLPKNLEAFSREAPIAKKFLTGAVALALISFATECLGGFTYFSEMVSWVWQLDSPWNIILGMLFTAVCLAGAVALAAALELVIWDATVFIVNAFLYNRTKGLDLWSLIFSIIGLVVFLTFSIVVSKRVAWHTFYHYGPKSEEFDITQLNQQYTAGDNIALAKYQTARSDVVSRYQLLEVAETNEYNSKANAKQADIEKYRDIEVRTGKVYTSTISRLVREKNNLAIQYNSKVKKLAEEREKELKALTSTKNETGEQLFMRADSLYQQAYAKWQKNQEETEAWRMQFASMLSLFAGVSVVLSMILHVFVIIFYKKAEMTDEVVINHEDFEPQVWSEFKVWLKLKTVRGLRNKIRRAISGADNLTPFPYERLALLVNEKPAAGAPSTPQEVQPIKMEVGARELRELYEEIYQRLAGDLKEAHPTKAAPPPVEEEVKPPAPEEKPEKAAPPPVSTRRESSEHVTTIFVNGEAIIRHINSYGQVSEIGFDKVKKQIPVYRTRKSEKAQEINDLEGKLATLASDDPEREKLEKKLAAARASYQTNSENLEKFLAYRKILRPDEGD